jgi:hypothetical protein
MMRTPDLTAIREAELRIEQARRDTREHCRRARAASRSILARPSTLALTATAACVLGLRMTRQARPSTNVATVVNAAAKTSVIALTLGFLARYAVQILTPLVLRHWADRHHRARASREPLA